MILDDWFKTAQWSDIVEEFILQFDIYREKFSGDSLLQIGQFGNNQWLKYFNYRKTWITNSVLGDRSNCVALPQYLPFDRNSMDCIIAPFVMELSANDEHCLDEIDRVLKPMGYVVFLNVNPFSLWGLTLKCMNLCGNVHHSYSLTSFFKLQNAMTTRGYQQCLLKHFYFIPPFMNKSLLHKLNFLNHMGKIIAPFPSGFYCLIMQKYQPDYLVELLDTGSGCLI